MTILRPGDRAVFLRKEEEQMGGLSGFFKQNAVQVDNQKTVASRRFLDGDQNPMEWEMKCITPAEDEEIRRGCTKRVPLPGKKGQYTAEVDADLYLGKLAAACTVFPDLSDRELQDSYGVMGADSLLKAMLTPGEYAGYLNEVQALNGFDVTMDEVVEQAKN